MREAAKKFEFERAAQLRDRIRGLKQKDLGGLFATVALPGLETPQPRFDRGQRAETLSEQPGGVGQSSRAPQKERRKRRKA
jgi:penicillin V acylase-like amidase (Ntn superfamily)